MSQRPQQVGYDLHLHTAWSYDASADAETYFREARRLGVRCLAITEHHNVDSGDEVDAVARAYPEIRLIPAAELTVTTPVAVVDLLCYNLPRQADANLQAVYDAYHRWQCEQGAAICAAMQARGFAYTDDDRLALLRSCRPPRTLAVQGFTHVDNRRQANFFIQRGYIADRSGYGRLMADIADALPPYPAAEYVVPIVKRTGAIISLAHPLRTLCGDLEPELDVLRDLCQLDAIECGHPSASAEQVAWLHDYCTTHGLLPTGGSDCHHEPDVLHPSASRFARHGGSNDWLDAFLERLGG